MKQKFFVTVLLFLFSVLSISAKHIEIKSKHDIMTVVSAGNIKLNAIYNKKVYGNEEDKSDLKNAIYKANSPMVDIRSILAPFDVKLSEKTIKAVQNNLDSLATLLDEVDEKQDQEVLVEKINKIGVEADAVLNGLKKGLKLK